MAQPFTRELLLTTENDSYLFSKHDAYYTNGLFFRLDIAREKSGRKIIHRYELGQCIYTPLARNTRSPADIDRPYCGFLFARYGSSSFPDGGAVFGYDVTLGMVGNASLGEDMQNGYHRLFHYARFAGWKYQVKNAIGIDISVNYTRTVLQTGNIAKLAPVAELSLGSNHTYAKAGTYVCIGAFEQNAGSALFSARIDRTEKDRKRNYELFAYWRPDITWQGYNATVQGGLFTKGDSAVLAKPERVMFQHAIGLCFAQSRWTVKAAVVFENREAITQAMPQRYGSLQVSYRMH